MSKSKITDNPTSNFSTEEPTPKGRRFDKRAIFISKIKRRFLSHVWLARLAIITAVALVIYLVFFILNLAFSRIGLFNYTRLISDFLFTPEKKIESVEGRTNILVLGKAGEGHTAPDLTDTIIFVSFLNRGERAVLISLPRDIWVPELRAKLNSTYYWGNQKLPPVQGAPGPEGEGGGLILAKSSTEEIIGKPVHYGVVIDFTGFVQMVDVLGGIEVDVERGFVDERYPIAGKEEDECDGDPEYNCRYETILFEFGQQTMNGATALKFVRSRNAEGDEGTDLARSLRQQKVIDAFKEKVLSPKTILSIKKLISLWRIAESTIETDVDAPAAAILARWLFNSREQIDSLIIPDEFLYNPPKSYIYDNLYVFVPKSGDWKQVQEWVDCVLEKGECN